MDEQGNKALVVSYWQRAWNEHDLGALDETHAPWFAQNGVAIGVHKFRESMTEFLRSFPDMRVTIEDLIAVQDKVLARVTYSGTHLGDYRGIPPTRRAISVTGLELFLVGDGRIVQHWHETDHLGILEQIGCTVAPPA